MRISDWSSDVCSSDLVRLCATGGAFPFEYTSGSFPDKDVAKIADRNKWIFRGQLGVDWAVNDALQVKLGAAYYDFTNVQGQLSEPCALSHGNTQCPSDGTRPPRPDDRRVGQECASPPRSTRSPHPQTHTN